MNHLHRRKQAFTLIELLVVISIISLLVALLLPVLGKARQSGTTVQCLSNIRGMFLACSFFSNDYKGWYPPNGAGVTYGLGSGYGNWHYTSYLDKRCRYDDQSHAYSGCGGDYIQVDPHINSHVPGKWGPSVRCPELTSAVLATGRQASITAEPNTDYALSLLTGQPKDNSLGLGNPSSNNPWQFDVTNPNYWYGARNSGPGAQAGRGLYGPYRAEEVPSRIILLADAPVELSGPSSLAINPSFQWYPSMQSNNASGPNIAGSIDYDVSASSYYQVDNAFITGSTSVKAVQFNLHFNGFNSIKWDGSGKTISYSSIGCFPWGSYSGTYSQYYKGAGNYQNITNWCPPGNKYGGDTSRASGAGFFYGNGANVP